MSSLKYNPIIKNISLKDIKPYSNNPRKKQNIKKVVNSIKEFGFQQPIVVDKKNIIIVGHSRYEASKELGLDKVPVIIADLSPVKAKAYRIADNRINQDSEWDFSKLTLEFKEISKLDFNLDSLGFEKNELDDLIIDEVKGFTDDDAVPDKPKKPKSKLGEIYQLGHHRVMCGDATKEEDVNKLINNNNIDLLYTDPPYGINIKGDRTARNTGLAPNHKFKDFKDDSIDYAITAIKIINNLKIPRQVWWGANYYCHFLPLSNNWFVWDKRVDDKMKDTQSDCEMAWVKSKWSSIRIFRHLWKGFNKDSERNQQKVHPTQKPVALAKWSFDYFRDVKSVLDLFGGSGSTLIACEKTNRICCMMELDTHYCDVIIKRWEDYTGKSSKKI